MAENDRDNNALVMGLSLGPLAGVVVGLLFLDNLGLGIALGLGAGAVFGVLAQNRGQGGGGAARDE
ncbi:hypothetical protein [Streptomyces luteireticuli]|uniref:Glycine zipper-like domain-containing protein n=1 Tax=Streptomyces luteireticuli TaxID=173858 RepID=A0ABP3I066_9ACTN